MTKRLQGKQVITRLCVCRGVLLFCIIMVVITINRACARKKSRLDEAPPPHTPCCCASPSTAVLRAVNVSYGLRNTTQTGWTSGIPIEHLCPHNVLGVYRKQDVRRACLRLLWRLLHHFGSYELEYDSSVTFDPSRSRLASALQVRHYWHFLHDPRSRTDALLKCGSSLFVVHEGKVSV